MTTKTAQFTPGPWVANQSEMEAHSCKVEIRTTNGSYLICSDAGYQNAPLIAAAPAMYEALKGCLRVTEAWKSQAEMNGDTVEIEAAVMEIRRIKAALAQAEGRHHE